MSKAVTILKYGSSTLGEKPGLSKAVFEIYQEIRLGRPVLAIVQTRDGAPAAAGFLRRALDEAGIPSALIGPLRPRAGCGNSTPDARPHLPDSDVFRHAPVAILAGTDRQRPLRVALLGLGNIGLGVFERLTALPEHFEVAGIAVRDLDKPRPDHVPRELLVDDPWRLLAIPVDVVVELIGGIEPAASLIGAALEDGLHVVTANKEVLAVRGPCLQETARCCGVELKYSASVGGAVPVLERLRALPPGSVASLQGIVNGTCNFVLDQLALGLELDAAVRRAQEQGFAEADPGKDLSGADSAHKLTIIARCAFGVNLAPEQISTTGIERLDPRRVQECRARGAAIRLVASCSRAGGKVRATVRPVELPEGDFLAGARGAENRLRIRLSDGRSIRLSGKGAGGIPTSLAVLADLLDLCRAREDEWLHSTFSFNRSEVSDEPSIPVCIL